MLLKETEGDPKCVTTLWLIDKFYPAERTSQAGLHFELGRYSFFQSIDDNCAPIFYEFMPLHINLCINLRFVYFIDFVFVLILFGVQPARQFLCVPGGEEMFYVNEQFYGRSRKRD